MKGARRAQGHRRLATDKRGIGRTDIPTVASLGVQARLIAIDADREREIKDLIKSCEMLRAEWKRLFHRAIDLLEEGGRRVCDSRSSPPVPDA